MSHVELRWAVPKDTSTRPPRLQYRTCETRPHWGDWQDVPTVVAEPPKRKYKFAVGIARLRTVTVRADDRYAAALKARGELDRRANKRNEEPPVAWDLSLVAIDDRPWP